MSAPTLLRPNSEVVGVSWARRVPGIPDSGVATNLPTDRSKLVDGFVQLIGVATGTAEIEVPLHRPVLTFACWAAPANEASSKPPWAKAARMAEALWESSFYETYLGINVQGIVIPMYLPGYANARILTVNAVSEPVRVPDDPSNYARFDVDLELNWTGVRPS
jgi:hypothetical protein